MNFDISSVNAGSFKIFKYICLEFYKLKKTILLNCTSADVHINTFQFFVNKCT